MDPPQDAAEVDWPKASMDIQSLNTLVVNLRKLTKRVRLFAINKLVRQSKQLRLKKCTEERKEANMKKAERLIQEIGGIKELDLDQTIKFSLGNTATFSALAATGDLETRAKGRLATHPLMATKVDEWRKEHEDWKALAAFLVSKNTGRRMKKKKKEEPRLSKRKQRRLTWKEKEQLEEAKAKAAKAGLPMVGQGKSAKELARQANEKAKKEAKRKAKMDAAAAKAAQENDSEKDVSDSEENSEPKAEATNVETKESPDTTGDVSEGSDSDSGEASESDDCNVNKETSPEDKPSTEKEDAVIHSSVSEEEESGSESASASDGEDDGDSDSDGDVSDQDDEEEEPEEKIPVVQPSPKKIKTKDVNEKIPVVQPSPKKIKAKDVNEKEENKPVVQPSPKKSKTKVVHEKEERIAVVQPAPKRFKPEDVKPFIKRDGDMVISKIDVKALSNSSDILSPSGDGKALVTESKQYEKSKPKKRKDAFFMTEGSDDSDGEEEDGTNETSEKKWRAQDEEYEPERKISRRKMESTFVTNLGQRRNRLWYSDFNDDEPEEGRNQKYQQGHNNRESSWATRGPEHKKDFNTNWKNTRGDRDSSGTTHSTSHRHGPSESRGRGQEDTGAQEANLHPSWEARRKKKEQEKNIFNFAGKRTTFED